MHAIYGRLEVHDEGTIVSLRPGKATIKGCTDDIKGLMLNDGLDQAGLLKHSAINVFNKFQ